MAESDAHGVSLLAQRSSRALQGFRYGLYRRLFSGVTSQFALMSFRPRDALTTLCPFGHRQSPLVRFDAGYLISRVYLYHKLCFELAGPHQFEPLLLMGDERFDVALTSVRDQESNATACGLRGQASESSGLCFERSREVKRIDPNPHPAYI